MNLKNLSGQRKGSIEKQNEYEYKWNLKIYRFHWKTKWLWKKLKFKNVLEPGKEKAPLNGRQFPPTEGSFKHLSDRWERKQWSTRLKPQWFTTMFVIILIILIKTMILSSNQSSVDDMAAVARGDGQTRSCSSFLPFDCYCCNCNCYRHPHCCCHCSCNDHNFVVCCPRGDNQTRLSVVLLHSW